MSRSSITTEIEAVHAGMETSGEGLDAFRQGGIAVRDHAEQVDVTVPLHVLVEIAEEIPTENPFIEAALENYPDEFALGAAVMAYRIRKDRGQA
jgi:hypothetical protein